MRGPSEERRDSRGLLMTQRLGEGWADYCDVVELHLEVLNLWVGATHTPPPPVGDNCIVLLCIFAVPPKTNFVQKPSTYSSFL